MIGQTNDQEHIEYLLKYPVNDEQEIKRFKHFRSNEILVRDRYEAPTLKNHMVRKISIITHGKNINRYLSLLITYFLRMTKLIAIQPGLIMLLKRV